MLEPDLFEPFIRRFEQLGAPYMLTGSIAGIVYGEPRMTHDIDLVLTLRPSDASRLESLFRAEEFYCPPADVIAIEAKRPQRGHINLIAHATAFKADVYFAYDALHEFGLSSRRRLSFGEVDAWVAPPEYVILRKLAYFREGGSQKHLRDIAAILSVSRDLVDVGFVSTEAEGSGLASQWEAAKTYDLDS
ncbi:MAG: hypothetical protein AAF735_05520 [Myxococcota bacterium]